MLLALGAITLSVSYFVSGQTEQNTPQVAGTITFNGPVTFNQRINSETSSIGQTEKFSFGAASDPITGFTRVSIENSLDFFTGTTTSNFKFSYPTSTSMNFGVVALHLTTAPTDTYGFSVSTSTAATSISGDTGGGVIATTTVATSTTAFFKNNTATSTNFLLNTDEYILGTFDSRAWTDVVTVKNLSASSTAYTSAAGTVIIECRPFSRTMQ